MSPPGNEHFLSAERWLYKAKNEDARGEPETAESCAAIAQVHAILALVWAVNRMQADAFGLQRFMAEQILERAEAVAGG